MPALYSLKMHFFQAFYLKHFLELTKYCFIKHLLISCSTATTFGRRGYS